MQPQCLYRSSVSHSLSQFWICDKRKINIETSFEQFKVFRYPVRISTRNKKKPLHLRVFQGERRFELIY